MRPPEPGGDPAEIVYGLRPVEEILSSRPAEVERVMATREKSRGVGPLLKAARKAGIPVTYLSRDSLRRKLGKSVHHQGIAAIVAPQAYVSLERILGDFEGQDQVALVFLDRVVDPGNLGAILRTCAGAGVGGAILSAEGSAGLGPAAMRSSAGFAEKVLVARSLKPGRDLDRLREAGFRIFGLDASAPTDWDRADLRGRIVVVAGGEERGMRPTVAAACDARVRIPLADGVESLNVGISVGVLLFEALRQRRRSPKCS